MNDVMTASIPLNFYFQKPSGVGRHMQVEGSKSPYEAAGLSAAESMADAQQKIGQAHSLAVSASSVADWTNVAQLASDGAAEVADVNVHSPAIASISQWASDANLHLNEITGNSGISVADAQTAALKAVASADAALLEATTQPGSGGSGGSGGSTSGGTTSTPSTMSTTTKVALGVIAASAIAAGGYMVWKNMKKGRR